MTDSLRPEKDWPLEKVMAADAEYRKVNPDAPSWSTPIFVWTALHNLDREEQRFREGDTVALLAAVALCANHGLAMPDWVATNYLNAYRRVIHYRARNWDEVFGRPLKGRHLASARKRWEKGPQVYNRVRKILATEPETPIDDRLFERVGKEFGLSKTVASELYYEMANLPISPVVQALLEPYIVPVEHSPRRKHRRR